MSAKIWPWRRAAQLLVLAAMILFPFISRYGHYLWARRVEKMRSMWEGSAAGAALTATDALMRVGLLLEEAGVKGRLPRRAALARVDRFIGAPPWSARIFGVSFTDLLAVSESALATRSLRMVLITGAVIPILATVLLGRVYCGWLCPVGLLLPLIRRLRSVAAFLELPVEDVRFWKGNKYAVLGAASLIAVVGGVPILNQIYPPAVLSRESHAFATVLFDRAEGGLFGFPWEFLSGGLVFLALIAFLEVALAPGFWCATLCPGGALYSALSRWKILRVKRVKPACVDCDLCDKACPMQLRPMSDQTGAECDACGVCVDVCPTRALSLRFARTDAPLQQAPKPRRRAAAGALLLLLALSVGASAHHIIGIPHYAYDKSYPQAPVLRLRDKIGQFVVTLTVYPGNPRPGERSEIHVYLTDPATDTLYDKAVFMEAYRVHVFGYQEKIQEASESVKDMTLHKFHVVFPAEANYEVVLVLPGFDGTSTLRFPMVVGEPGSPWRDVSLFGGAFLGLVVVVRAVKIKRARRRAAGAAS